ncbi:hypothetical protein [Hymenobacter crusticola]|uniref:Uncharacterized protein n=1 Tax=Hymenobacter crusticola TaxID=1770526 RepID=A0A243WGP4_9BACT|nr:hypothetical protein [Hymenobacter crusticola]OUJ74922.1 hypothetical protein BXP70_09250 [Hymenobacter crusticola]
MINCFPFEVHFVNGAARGSPEQMYQVIADFSSPAFSSYKALFDKYGAAEGLLSLVDLTAFIIEERAPTLLDHLDFDEEGYQLDMHVDSDAALQVFRSAACPVFQNLDELTKYLIRIVGR